MRTVWVVTAVEHPSVRGYRGTCDDCMDLADAAIRNAIGFRAPGATFEEGRRRWGRWGKLTFHSCTVAKALLVETGAATPC